ncbi:unnamed protein product, partial [Nesidiocoris tenuis]
METSKSAPASPAASPPSHHPPPVTRAQVQQHSQQQPPPSLDLIIGDCMERLGTRIGLLESELRYAWRALDLLSQEYLKMWERLEKLELLLCEQQGVISQLIDFYTAVESGEVTTIVGGCSIEEAEGGSGSEGGSGAVSCMDLVPVRRGDSIVTDSELAISSTTDALISELKMEMGVDDMNLPDEAFYRSLNNAYRNDLVSTMHPPVAAMGASQLGMIWEEPEEDSNGNGRRDEVTILADDLYSSVEYKDYQESSPCVSNQDIHQLTELSTMDQAAIEKLKELDILTTQLQKDSRNLKELQDRLLCESPQRKYIRSTVDDPSTHGPNELDEQISRMYEESGIDNWSFRDDHDDDLLIKEPFENELKEEVRRSTVAYSSTNLLPSQLSPRKRLEENVYSPNRLDTSSPLSMIGSNRSLPSSPKFKEGGHSSPYKSVSLDQPETEFELGRTIYQDSKVAVSSGSIRTRQDGYIPPADDLDLVEPEPSVSGSPPPPAPHDCTYLLPSGNHTDESSVHLYSTTDGLTVGNVEQPVGLSQRTPAHSPKSPRTSPKHVNKSSAKLASAKSDSGLSSMSGWSSLEKSPGSPKASKTQVSQHVADNCSASLHARAPPHASALSRLFPSINVHPSPERKNASETNTFSGNDNGNGYNGVLPGGHLASSFTPVRTPTNMHDIMQEGFVPPPAPEIPGTPQRRHESFEYEPTEAEYSQEFPYQNERPPAIYSVAGSNRQQYFTSVYSNKPGGGGPANIVSYPDVIGPYMSDQYRDILPERDISPYDHKKAYPIGYTTVVPNTKRSLQRVYSTGSVPSHQIPDGTASYDYNNIMYHSLFASGNITDALTYYPPGNVYSQIHSNAGQAMGPRVAYQECWGYDSADVDLSRESSASTIRSAASTVQEISFDGRYIDPRTPPKKPLRSDLSGSQQTQQHPQTGWIPQGEENTRIVMEQRPNIVLDPRLKQNEYYDPSSIIVSQSGYISFSSDLKETVPEDKTKKTKKHATLKHAMSQVSQWLPDLHLPKRHRSQSLPSGVRREDYVKSKEANGKEKSQASAASGRKKKKHNIVSTMSGILQKAKRRGYGSHSMSDPEHSDIEWGGRHSGMSEDSEDSAYSELQRERPVPKVIRQNSAPPRPPQPRQIPPKLLQQSQSLQQDSPPQARHFRPNAEEIHTQKQNSGAPPDQPAPLFAKMLVSKPSDEPEQNEPVPAFVTSPPKAAEPFRSSLDGNADLASLFQTVGDVKKSSNGPKEETVEEPSEKEQPQQQQQQQVNVVPPSREFAVSRALGKYRRRQSSTASEEETQKVDDMYQIITQDEEEEEMRRNEIFERISSEESNNKMSQSQSQPENLPTSEGNSTNHRGHGRFAPPRQQQSLEIPWGGRGSGDTDDDNRSTHSWRSTSRVSSRRQSTEDSIDSEDEWYCYELRKLEEMEKGGGAVFPELPYDNEREILAAQMQAKHRMSTVLQELTMKIVPKIDIQEEKMLAQLEPPPPQEPERKESVGSAKLMGSEDGSSGDTSGPDSPGHQSADEAEELEPDVVDRRDSARDSNRGSIQERQSREGSMSMGGEQMSYTEESYQQSEVSEEAWDNVPGTPSLPRFTFDPPNQSFSPPPQPERPAEEEQPDQSGSSGAPKGIPTGKWKLLKALKERKAEEKSQEAEKKEAAAATST